MKIVWIYGVHEERSAEENGSCVVQSKINQHRLQVKMLPVEKLQFLAFCLKRNRKGMPLLYIETCLMAHRNENKIFILTTFDLSFYTTAHCALTLKKSRKCNIQSVQSSAHPQFVTEATPSAAFKFVREPNMTG